MADLPHSIRNLTSGLVKELTRENIKKLLDPTKKIPSNVIEISNLDINYFKDLDAQESKTISDIFGVKTIRELADITYRQLVEKSIRIQKMGISQGKLELMITAAKYISKAARYRPPEGQKIVLVGLDNAGKTALLNAIKNEIMDISQLKPTQGMQRQTLHLKEQKLYIFELGGQEVYRKNYLAEPEKYVLGTDLMVFLIDMQDQDRYNAALEYLEQILDIIKYLNEKPEFIILLHKSDPNIFKLEPLFREKIDYISSKIKKIFQSYSFQYSIQISSIYNIINLTKSFQYILKKLFAGELERELESREVIEFVSKLVEMILNIESDVTKELSTLSENLYQMKEEFTYLKKLILFEKTGAIKETISTLETNKSGISSREMFIKELKQFLIKKE
ncbi:MAG: 50S ribosome-binding GTPase [Candidatus Helarchaeota archaeon]|nr:50S ribosome-binding GTPase [Candidatus Helarchaeota archaeon]